MQPRTLSREEALNLATDALREAGFERFAWLLADPVRLELTDLLATHELYEHQYEDSFCSACGSEVTFTALHDEDCFLLHAWKVIGDARYKRYERAVAERQVELERLAAEKAERERLFSLHGRCEFKNERGGRCTRHGQHTGDHWCEWVMQGTGEFFGLDRNAPPARVSGVRVDLPADDPASKIITDPLNVIVSPHMKEGEMYLIGNQLAMSPRDADLRDAMTYSTAHQRWNAEPEGGIVDAMKRAKEALEKMKK